MYVCHLPLINEIYYTVFVQYSYIVTLRVLADNIWIIIYNHNFMTKDHNPYHTFKSEKSDKKP